MRAAKTLAVISVALMALTACTPDGISPVDSSTSVPSAQLRVAVFGAPSLIAAYQSIAADYTAAHPQVRVSVTGYASWADENAALAKVQATKAEPDLFLTPDNSLDALVTGAAIQPVGDLLASHQIDFGDGFDRTSLETFSRQLALQCMPIDRSPLVIYYNTAYVNLSLVPTAGEAAIDPNKGWTWDDFTRAAAAAVSTGHRALAIDPTLDQVGAFLAAGGSSIVDDPKAPTSLAIDDDKTAAALENLLVVTQNTQVARPPAATLPSAFQQFASGQVAMTVGYRDLVPTLRAVNGLNFDVLPIPTMTRAATSGRADGMCMSSQTASSEAAADFLRALVSDAAMSKLAKTGAVVPTNLTVANSDDYLQPTAMPAASRVFVNEIQHIRELPTEPEFAPVQAGLEGFFKQLLASPAVSSQDQLKDELTAVSDGLKPLMDAIAASPSATPSATP